MEELMRQLIHKMDVLTGAIGACVGVLFVIANILWNINDKLKK